MAFNSFRMFLWKVKGKPPLSDEELISIIEKYITPDAFRNAYRQADKAANQDYFLYC